MSKSVIPLLLLTVVLVSADVYSTVLSVRYYTVARCIDIFVDQVILSVHETNMNIKVKVTIVNPTLFDLRLEYVGVRPYIDNKPLIDPKINPPFLGRNYFQGERSILLKLSNKTVTISFNVSVGVLPEAYMEKMWGVMVAIIIRDIPLVDQMQLQKYCNVAVQFVGD